MRTDKIKLRLAHYFKPLSAGQHATCRRNETSNELIVMLSGIYRAWPATDGKQSPMEARAGDVVYWPAGAERVEASDSGKPMRCIAIYFDWPRPTVQQPALVHDREGVISLLAHRLLTMRTVPTPLSATVGDDYVATMMAELLLLLSQRVDTLIGRVAQYVENNMARPFTLAELARNIGLQRHHFGRRFRTMMGITPMEYVRRRRADYALKAFLGEARCTPKEVAPKVGCKDRRQLRRLLKQYYGLTVRDIKQRALGSVGQKTKSSSPGVTHFWLSPITASFLPPSKGQGGHRRRTDGK